MSTPPKPIAEVVTDPRDVRPPSLRPDIWPHRGVRVGEEVQLVHFPHIPWTRTGHVYEFAGDGPEDERELDAAAGRPTESGEVRDGR